MRHFRVCAGDFFLRKLKIKITSRWHQVTFTKGGTKRVDENTPNLHEIFQLVKRIFFDCNCKIFELGQPFSVLIPMEDILEVKKKKIFRYSSVNKAGCDFSR